MPPRPERGNMCSEVKLEDGGQKEGCDGGV